MAKTKQQTKNWRKIRLGEVFNISREFGRKIKVSEYKKKGKIPVYDQGNNEISGYTDDISSVYKGKLPAILFGDHTLKLRIINHSFSIGADGIQILEPSEKIFDRVFFFYCLKFTISKLLKSYGYERHLKYLKEVEVVIPEDINEQKRIADILSAFDEKIELNNKINQILEEMAQAIFKEWFVKSEKLKMKSEKLSNLVDTQYGYTQTANDKEIGPKFLRVKDINKANWIDWNSVPYCRIGEENFKKYKLKKGDIVIARMADPGKVEIIEREINAVFGSYLIRLQIKSSKITPYFLYYYLKSPLYQNFILGVSTGTTRKSINAKMMVNCNILIPPREILEKFEMIISRIRQKINLNLVENQKLSALRDLLLPKLMSGEIRV